MTSTKSLAEDWRRCGIEPGRTTLIHSSIRRTLARMAEAGAGAATPSALLDSLLEAAEGGTLLFPLFNFQFTKGVPFNICTTPSEMGALTEAARRHPGAVRTGHPIYSFAAIGREADRFDGLCNESGYADDSPFGLLRRMDGRIAVLDLPDANSQTFYHHVEEVLGVDYRYFKSFTGTYVDASGQELPRSFSLFVRDLARGVETHVDPMGEVLWRQGLYRGDRPRTGSGLRSIDARAMFDTVAQVIGGGRAEGLLYRIGTA